MQKILKLCWDFRSTIEKMDIENFPNSLSFNNFPRGCCGDTSILLAKYLMDCHISTEYICGINKYGQSHAWLECEGWILDITADQFENIHDKVLIRKDKTWHSQFKRQKKEINDFEKFNTRNKNRLSKIYDNVRDNLSNDNKK